MKFAAAMGRADDMIMGSLCDGIGEYQDTRYGQRVGGLRLIVDRNLSHQGPEGIIVTGAVGVTWQKRCLPRVKRGGLFCLDGSMFQVDDLLDDDGHIATAVCTEVE